MGVIVPDGFENETCNRVQYDQQGEDLPLAPANAIESRQQARQKQGVDNAQRLGGFDGKRPGSGCKVNLVGLEKRIGEIGRASCRERV